jgi:hypothetical protein
MSFEMPHRTQLENTKDLESQSSPTEELASAEKGSDPIEPAEDEEDKNLLNEINQRIEEAGKEGFEMSFQEARLRMLYDKSRFAKKRDLTDYYEECLNNLRYLRRNDISTDKNLIPKLREILRSKTYTDLPTEYLNVLVENSSEILAASDGLERIRFLDILNEAGLTEELTSQIEEIAIGSGDISLYSKLCAINKRGADPKTCELIATKAQSLGMIYEALEASKLSGNTDLTQENQESMDNLKHRAEIKLQKMPEGFDTKGLMSHYTSLEYIGPILKTGLLSIQKQKELYGKENITSGADLQSVFGYDYISVSDPWSGGSTTPEGEAKQREAVGKIFNYLKSIHSELITVAKDHNLPRLIEDLQAYHSAYEQPYFINVNAITHPEYRPYVETISRLYEETMICAKDMPDEPVNFDKEYYTDTDYHYFYSSSRSPRLIINPDIERYGVLNAGFGPESFIKGQVSPDDILGVCIPEKYNEDPELLEYMAKMSVNNATPLHITSVSMEEDGEYTFKKLWPQ